MTNHRIKNIPDEAKAAMVYLFSSVLSKGLAIITTPIFTRIMPSSQVGIVNVFLSWYTILSGIVTLGLTSGGLMMSLNHYSDEKDKYLSSILTLTSISALLFGILYLFFSEFFKRITNLPDSMIILMLICFVFCPATDFWMAKQRYDYKYKLSGSIMIGSSIFASLFSVLAVLVLPTEHILSFAESRLFGTYIVSLVVGIILWILIFHKGKTLFNHEYWKYSLGLSIPLIGQMMAAQILGFSDRIMIERFCGDSQVGIYSTIYTIGTLTTMLWTAINSSFTPYIYRNIDERTVSIKKNSFLILVSFSLVSILVSLFGPEITRIVGPEEYYEGVYIIPPVAAGVYLIAIGDLYSDLLIYVRKTKFIMLATVCAAVSNIVLNIIFIPAYGYVAAAFTTLCSYVLMAFLLVVLTRNQYKQQTIAINEVFRQQKIFVLSGITVLVDLLCLFIYKVSWIRYSVIAVFFVLLIFFVTKTKMISELKSVFSKRD